MCALKDQGPGAAAALEVLRRALAGRYLLKREVGRGATAHVYLADDLKHDRPVAVKVLRTELVGRVGVERFLREIRIEARLQHPNIPYVTVLMMYVKKPPPGASRGARASRSGLRLRSSTDGPPVGIVC